jgi:hypothetical protein
MLAVCAFASATCTSPETPEGPQESALRRSILSQRLEIGTGLEANICRGQFDLWEEQIDAHRTPIRICA